MKRCEFCGSELPNNAQFCGNCGHMVDDRYATMTDISNPQTMCIPDPQTPPLFSSPKNPSLQGSGMGWQDADSTFRTRWSFEEMESIQPLYKDRKTDENEAVLPDMLLPGMLVMRGQMPSPAQAPMVQGSPQFGGVPSVQGTPAVPGNAPQSIPGPAHGAASSAPSYAPQEPQSISVHHQPVQHPWHQPQAHHYQPVHHPQPAPPTHVSEHKHHQSHHTGPLPKHKPRTSKLHSTAAATSKAGMGVASKWLIVAIAALVIIGSSSLILAHALIPASPPVLTVSGSTVVRGGSVLQLHGKGFQPGDAVTLTFDNGLPVTLSGQHGTQAVSQRAEMNSQVAGMSQMNIAGVLQRQSAATTNITVSSSGTFDASVTVPSGLSAGKHTIQATDNQSSQSASLQFTVPSPQLAVNPTALNFGSVEVGRTVKLSVTLGNQGGASLFWSATVDGSNTNWLTLSNSNGVIGTNGSGKPVIVTANTNGLSMGPHTAMLRFHSDNGYVQTTVKINVVSIAQSGQQAILNIPQQNLDYSQLQAGQQAQQSISVANLGNLPLQWQASSDAASATWLSLATSKGTVQPGAVPQTVQVNVNTTGMVAGSYSGAITITSNGGNSQVKVTLVVTGSSVTPTPSPSPSQSPSPSPIATPTVTGISPASGSSTGGINVTITGTGFSGATNVSFGQTAASNVTVINDTQIKATNPAGSGTVDVKVTTPGGTSANSSSDRFTYTIVPPTWSVNPTSLDSSTCGQSTSCTVTLTEDASSTVNIDWTVSSDVGATFNLTKGTLKPGGQQPISISGITCKNGTFTFNGTVGVSPLTVSWNCTIIQTPPTPKITVTPQNIDSTNCSPNSDGTYNCTVTVGETTAGSLNWSAPTGISGTNISFKPANGQLTTSNTQQPVTISSIPCSNTSFTFTDQNKNTATVAWSCKPPPPALTVAASGNCPPNSSGNYICTDTLTITGSQGSINWSVSAESDLPGTSFSLSNGTLTAGQSPQSVTVTIPGSDCPKYSGGHYDYSWTGSNTARVTFTCLSPTPTPQQTPQPTPPPPKPTPQPTLQLGLSFLIIPSMILIAGMTRFYEYVGRTKHSKRKPRC